MGWDRMGSGPLALVDTSPRGCFKSVRGETERISCLPQPGATVMKKKIS